jgi:hypothetical protein
VGKDCSYPQSYLIETLVFTWAFLIWAPIRIKLSSTAYHPIPISTPISNSTLWTVQSTVQNSILDDYMGNLLDTVLGKSLHVSWHLGKIPNSPTKGCICIVFKLPHLYYVLWLCALPSQLSFWIGLEPILHNSFTVETQHFLKTIIAYMIIYLLHMTNKKLETLVHRKNRLSNSPLLGIMVLSF